jgi:hypothetical protein
MLAACRLAGLSALDADYARVGAGAQFGAPFRAGLRLAVSQALDDGRLPPLVA